MIVFDKSKTEIMVNFPLKICFVYVKFDLKCFIIHDKARKVSSHNRLKNYRFSKGDGLVPFITVFFHFLGVYNLYL